MFGRLPSMRPSAALLVVSLMFLALGAATCAAAYRPVVLGVNTTGVTERTGASLDRFASATGRMPKIVMYYRDWDDRRRNALITPSFLRPIVARRAVPMITWLPRLGEGDPVHQPDFSPAAIAAGGHDLFVRRAAREAAAYGSPLLLRFAHEMNGAWSSWGAWVDGNQPSDYVAMWQHVVSIFRMEGATNVRWVWSPNVYREGGFVLNDVSAMPFQPFYPGDRWVDFVALDGYNWGALNRLGWQSFLDVFKNSYDALVALTGKPAMIAETASTELGGDKAAWIRKIPGVLRSQMPRIRAMIWFDREKEADWMVDSSSASAFAFRAIARNPLLSGAPRELLRAGKPTRRESRR